MKKTGLFILLSLAASVAGAWGNLGHRTTGDLAQAMLSPAAKAAVNRLLKGQTLGEVASWADGQKGGTPYGHTAWYHFEKMNDGIDYIPHIKQLAPDQLKKGGIVGAILVAQETLRSQSATQDDQEVALKFLVHFIGDLHQPLHTGRPEDKGGVTLDVNWFGQPTSLHGIWDTGMIMVGHDDLFKGQTADYAVLYARWLAKTYQNWHPSSGSADNIEGWLDESLQIRPSAYVKTYVSDPQGYLKKNLTSVDQRIYAAGYRMAQNLNAIFASEPVPSVERDLWKKINGVVRDLHNIISLEPK